MSLISFLLVSVFSSTIMIGVSVAIFIVFLLTINVVSSSFKKG